MAQGWAETVQWSINSICEKETTDLFLSHAIKWSFFSSTVHLDKNVSSILSIPSKQPYNPSRTHNSKSLANHIDRSRTKNSTHEQTKDARIFVFDMRWRKQTDKRFVVEATCIFDLFKFRIQQQMDSILRCPFFS